MDTKRDCICASIRKASRAITLLYNEFLIPSGLQITQYSLLVNIRRLERVTVTRLVDQILMDKTTLSRNLRLLSEKGFVAIKQGKDRRVKRITLTQSGNEALETARPLWEEAQAHVVQCLGKNGVDQLIEDLGKLILSLRR
jgi:DNA-binding MarR family transcriptional regulator